MEKILTRTLYGEGYELIVGTLDNSAAARFVNLAADYEDSLEELFEDECGDFTELDDIYHFNGLDCESVQLGGVGSESPYFSHFRVDQHRYPDLVPYNTVRKEGTLRADTEFILISTLYQKGCFGSILLPSYIDPQDLHVVSESVEFADRTYLPLYGFSSNGSFFPIDDSDVSTQTHASEFVIFDTKQRKNVIVW